MTSHASIGIREVIFINERCRIDYEALPEAVRESADQAVDALQNGRSLSRKMHRPLKGKLAGINEIKLPYDDDTYRVYINLKCPWAIMVLDAGIKKSTEGDNIPKWQQERLETRHKKAQEYYARQDAELKADYEKREARRKKFKKETGT